MRCFSKTLPLSGAILLSLLCLQQISRAQSTPLLPDKTVQAIIAEASGEIALHNEMMLGPFERIRAEKDYTGRVHTRQA
jgi:hypothetical protein